MKFYIYSTSYNERSGGSVVLHRLCHLLNSMDGIEAYIVPNVPEKISTISIKEFLSDIYLALKIYMYNIFSNILFKTHPDWKTPVIKKNNIKDIDSSIVVYPEITYGNPLAGKNVVRWLLHNPGYFTETVNYGINELYFKFNSAVKDFELAHSVTSKNELKIIYYPLEYYNSDGATNSKGSCHAIRKGKGKAYVHSSDSILIDGMSHVEVSRLLKKTQRFISYDEYTAYSIFAVLCGCQSIVVPSPGVSKEEWYPNPSDRYGIAYGLNEIELEHAYKTKHYVLEHIIREHEKSSESARSFAYECASFFNVT